MSLAVDNWESFMSVAAETSATLTVLVFMAVSMNRDRIIGIPGLSSLAAESIIQLLGAVFMAFAALIPGQSLATPAIHFASLALPEQLHFRFALSEKVRGRTFLHRTFKTVHRG
jgi:hypothetical protein